MVRVDGAHEPPRAVIVFVEDGVEKTPVRRHHAPVRTVLDHVRVQRIGDLAAGPARRLNSQSVSAFSMLPYRSMIHSRHSGSQRFYGLVVAKHGLPREVEV